MQCLKFTRDGRTLVTCGKDGTAKVWDLATGKVKATMAGHAGHVYSLDLSPDDQDPPDRFRDDTAILWDVETGERKGTILESPGWVEAVRYSPNATIFAAAGWDGVVNIWGPTAGASIRNSEGPAGGSSPWPSRPTASTWWPGPNWACCRSGTWRPGVV